MPQPARFRPTTVATMPPKRAHSAGLSPWRILVKRPLWSAMVSLREVDLRLTQPRSYCDQVATTKETHMSGNRPGTGSASDVSRGRARGQLVTSAKPGTGSAGDVGQARD